MQSLEQRCLLAGDVGLSNSGLVSLNEDAGPQAIAGFASFTPDSGGSETRVQHDEGANGAVNPLSRDNLNPTSLGVFAPGSNLVQGHIESALGVGDVDLFTFTIAPGTQLDGLFVEAFGTVNGANSDSLGFLGIDDTGSFPFTPSELSSSDTNQFIGGTLFGVSDIGGGNILPNAGSFTGSGFTGPLGPGTYTIHVQQTGPATQYTLNFNVTGNSTPQLTAFNVDQISNPTLFAVAPSIDLVGNLTYTPADNAFGTSTFEVIAQVADGNGGTTNSEPQIATITVNPVNDAPTINTLGDINVLEDSGSQTINNFVSGFDPGPSESPTPTQSRVAFDEGDFGTTNPISIDNLNPTQLGTLSPGSNLISGFLETAFITGRVDVVTFTIPTGYEWSGLFVNEFEYLSPPGNDRAGFLAINDADFFPFDTDDLNINISPPVDQSLFLAGVTFGLDDLPSAGGGNILPRAGSFAGRGFSGPLPAGTYTIYTQQNGPQNRYTIDVQVTAVAPQSLVGFSIDNVSDPTLFAASPTIDSQGNLSFTPAADAFGSATFEVSAQDSGGVANGGVDRSISTTITLTIDGVNDAPGFTANNPPTTTPGAGSQLVTGFSQFIPGPANEADQTALRYTVSNVSDPSAFDVLPTISNTGDLAYTLGSNAAGVFQFDVTVQDSGGTAQGGTDTSSTQTFSLVVEDPLAARDFGDAPAAYPVSLADDGARHVISTLFLGSGVSPESDGTPSAFADGDDDDGVQQLLTPIASATSDTTARLQVTVSTTGLLNAWIDFNQDGDWDDSGEQITTDRVVNAGQQFIDYVVPAGTVAGTTVGRFRVSTQGSLGPTGSAVDGEVEDHLIAIGDSSVPTDISLALTEPVLSITQNNDQFALEDLAGTLLSAPVSAARNIELQGNTTDDIVSLDGGNGGSAALPSLSFDGLGGFDQLRIQDYREPIDVTSGGNARLSNLEQIDSNDGVVTTLRVDVASIESLNGEQLLLLTGNNGDVIEFLDPSQWRLGATAFIDGVFTRDVEAIDSQAVLRTDLSNYWQNIVNPNDINNDGDVEAIDVLLIINELSRNSFSEVLTGQLAAPEDLPVWPGVYYDQNSDGTIAAIDALRVINFLARQNEASQSSQAGEGEQIDNEFFFAQVAQQENPESLLTGDSTNLQELPGEIASIQTAASLMALEDPSNDASQANSSVSDATERESSSNTASLFDEALSEEPDWRSE